MMNNNEGCATALAVILVYAIVWLVISLIFAFPVMWLWNWLMPAIFKLPTITVAQALGLNLLASFLFKGTTNINQK